MAKRACREAVDLDPLATGDRLSHVGLIAARVRMPKQRVAASTAKAPPCYSRSAEMALRERGGGKHQGDHGCSPSGNRRFLGLTAVLGDGHTFRAAGRASPKPSSFLCIQIALTQRWLAFALKAIRSELGDERSCLKAKTRCLLALAFQMG
jgi:hypothetical protein